jgi:hypothetical protein
MRAAEPFTLNDVMEELSYGLTYGERNLVSEG